MVSEKSEKVSDKDDNLTNEINDFDDILDHIGGWGPFQYYITFLFLPFNFFLGYIYLSPILTQFAPPHWCSVPALSNMSWEQRRNISIPRDPDMPEGFSQCSQYLVDWESTEEISEPNLSWPIGNCLHGWEYDEENYHRSIVNDFDWVCDDKWIPAMAQSLFFCGAIPGMLFFGWFSDHYGRIPTIVISNLIGCVAGISQLFVTGHISFFIIMFCLGLSFNTLHVTPYIVALEYVDVSKRTFVGNLGLALGLTVSGCIQPWLIKYLIDWKIFTWILFGQIGLVIFIPWIMPESVRWLLSRGHQDKSVTIIKQIAKMNGRKKIPDQVFEAVGQICKKEEEEHSKPHPGYIDLFRDTQMRRITLLSIALWMTISVSFDATVRNITNLNFNFYILFTISTALELPADLLSIVGLEKLGRRWSASLSLLGCAMTILPCAWLQDKMALQSSFAMSSRFFATYAINTGFQFSTEVMPTEIRSKGVALVNVMSMLSQMASPYIVYSSVISEETPYILLCIVAIAGCLPGLFLPETAGVSLPESIEDMKYFGRGDKFFWLPLCSSSRKRENYDSKSRRENIQPHHNEAFSETVYPTLYI